MENQYVLAMYDIRGKQDYIYKSNKMKEIIGASYIIRECFDAYLYPAAEKCSGKGLFSYKKEADPAGFSREGFARHLEEGYIGEVVYDGGGNFFVLYENAEIYRAVNQRFYRKVLEETYSLRVLTTYIEGIDFDNYAADQKKLYEKHRKREQKESMLHPVNALPIVQVDYHDSMPLSVKQKIAGRDQKVSYESSRKYRKYEEIMGRSGRDSVIEGDRLLDELITQKGEESLLAVIYIDGNNMGAQVEKCLNRTKRPDGERDTTYEASVRALREFSEYIQQHYIDAGIEEVDRVLEQTPNQKRRFVVYAGDEITFICNARNACDVAVRYLEKLSENEPEDAPRTSCAGIAVFHSHTPFSEAYRIAEECCEAGKKLMKKEKLADVSLIDFHYCQGAIGISLDQIREQEETVDISRPWVVRYGGKTAENEQIDGKFVTVGIVKAMQKELQKAGRSNVKDLLFTAKKSRADFMGELERIRAHQPDKEIDFTLGGALKDEEIIRKLIYDMVLVYDLWFDEDREEI